MDISEHSELFKTLFEFIETVGQIVWFENTFGDYNLIGLMDKMKDLFQKYESLKYSILIMNQEYIKYN